MIRRQVLIPYELFPIRRAYTHLLLVKMRNLKGKKSCEGGECLAEEGKIFGDVSAWVGKRRVLSGNVSDRFWSNSVQQHAVRNDMLRS